MVNRTGLMIVQGVLKTRFQLDRLLALPLAFSSPIVHMDFARLHHHHLHHFHLRNARSERH